MNSATNTNQTIESLTVSLMGCGKYGAFQQRALTSQQNNLAERLAPKESALYCHGSLTYRWVVNGSCYSLRNSVLCRVGEVGR